MEGSPLLDALKKRLRQLASGERSYCLQKPLKHGSKSILTSGFVLYESKLDKGINYVYYL